MFTNRKMTTSFPITRLQFYQSQINQRDQCDNPKTNSVNEDTATLEPLNTDAEQSEATDLQKKTLKKPDKSFPCPPCDNIYGYNLQYGPSTCVLKNEQYI